MDGAGVRPERVDPGLSVHESWQELWKYQIKISIFEMGVCLTFTMRNLVTQGLFVGRATEFSILPTSQKPVMHELMALFF